MCLLVIWCALTAVPSVSRPCGDWCVDGAEAGTLGCVLLYGILNPDYFTTGGMAHERGRVLEACRVTFQHSESYITKFAP